MAGLRAHAAWGGADSWDRYSYAHIKVKTDRTGGLCQKILEEKARVPPDVVGDFINRSLDHYLNQTYRALKCVRDGLSLAARLEAAEAVTPLLDALFALDGGRLRPFPKYLEWELAEYPLARGPVDLVSRLARLLEFPDTGVLRRLLADVDLLFRSSGYAPVFDAWGSDLNWMRDG